MLLAELGRRRHRGRSAFPASSAGWAPLWTLERAVTVWIAIAARFRGGARYRGQRLPTAATRPSPETISKQRSSAMSSPFDTVTGSLP